MMYVILTTRPMVYINELAVAWRLAIACRKDNTRLLLWVA